MFVIDKDYSREEIHAVHGGNKQAFLPTYRGKVVAACLKRERSSRSCATHRARLCPTHFE